LKSALLSVKTFSVRTVVSVAFPSVRFLHRHLFRERYRGGVQLAAHFLGPSCAG
jgi:hypothetical protein